MSLETLLLELRARGITRGDLRNIVDSLYDELETKMKRKWSRFQEGGDMLCEVCNMRDAKICYTEIINGQKERAVFMRGMCS